MIDINPTDPDNLVISGMEPGTDNMATWFSTDGGAQWTRVRLGDAGRPGVLDDGFTSSNRFDPWVVFDDSGVVYIGYLARIDNADGMGRKGATLVVCRSTDGGAHYDSPCTEVDTNVDPFLPPSRAGNDRLGMATGPDPTTPGQENVYIAWTQNYFDNTTPDNFRQDIVISRSTDGGVIFQPTQRVSDGPPPQEAVRGINADPAVGPNGELYVAWRSDDGSGGSVIYFDISTDGGAHFGNDRVIATSSLERRSNNLIPAQPSRGIILGPFIDVDRSGGDFDGRIYLIYTDVGPGGGPGAGDDTDIIVISSWDQGTTWSDPMTVNTGTNSQFLPYIDVDQVTGTVAAVWYDARNDANNVDVEVFMSISTDGGVTWGRNIRIADNASTEG